MNIVDRALRHIDVIEEQHRIARDKAQNRELNELRQRLTKILGQSLFEELGTTYDAYNGHSERKFRLEFYRGDFNNSHIVHTIKEGNKPLVYVKFTLGATPNTVILELFRADRNDWQSYAEESSFTEANDFLLSLGSFLRDCGYKVEPLLTGDVL